MDDENLRQNFSAPVLTEAKGEQCPSADTIFDSAAGRLVREQNEQVLCHLVRCPSCSTAWRLARELNPAFQETPETKRHRKPWPGWLAAAAVLLIAAGLGIGYFAPWRLSPPSFRAQPDEWLHSALPAGACVSRRDCVLRWTAGPPGTRYDISLSTEDLDSLGGAAGLTSPQFRVDPANLKNLPAGARILWRVTAHIPDGRVISSRTFTTRLE